MYVCPDRRSSYSLQRYALFFSHVSDVTLEARLLAVDAVRPLRIALYKPGMISERNIELLKGSTKGMVDRHVSSSSYIEYTPFVLAFSGCLRRGQS